MGKKQLFSCSYFQWLEQLITANEIDSKSKLIYVQLSLMVCSTYLWIFILWNSTENCEVSKLYVSILILRFVCKDLSCFRNGGRCFRSMLAAAHLKIVMGYISSIGHEWCWGLFHIANLFVYWLFFFPKVFQSLDLFLGRIKCCSINGSIGMIDTVKHLKGRWVGLFCATSSVGIHFALKNAFFIVYLL